MHIREPRNQLDNLLLQSRRQLIDFSAMADTKANILLSISSVLLTLTITRISDPAFKIPGIVLGVFLLITILMALLTVIPSLSFGGYGKHSVKDPQFNGLFFGDYSNVPYKDYVDYMEKLMNDPDRTYEAMVRELYVAGVYLQKTKYNFIKYGYLSFFVGLIASTLLYIFVNIF